MLVPGVVSATFKKKSAEEVIALAVKAGLEAVEWSEGFHVTCGDVTGASRLAALTAINGLKVAAYGSYYRLGTGMDFCSRIRTAKALGARFIRIWGGEKASSSLTKDERSALVSEARAIASEAGREGLTAALEWHKNTVTDTNESGLRFLDEVDSPYLRTLWQPATALSVQERTEGLKGIGARLVNLHVFYWDENGRLPLSGGEDDWLGYFSAVDGRDHYALLEFVKGDSPEQFLEDASVLKEWLRKGGYNG